MNYITGLIMVFIVIAYAIVFNVIDRQLDELRERINDLEDEIYDNEGDFLRDSDGNPIILIDDEDDDLKEGDN